MEISLKVFVAPLMFLIVLFGRTDGLTCYACDESAGDYNCDSPYFPTYDLQYSYIYGDICFVSCFDLIYFFFIMKLFKISKKN